MIKHYSKLRRLLRSVAMTFVASTLALSSCKDDTDPVKNDDDAETEQKVDVSKHDIYASLSYKNTYGSKKSIAAYWNKGQIITLSDTTYNSYAMSVFVDGEDVYVAGSSNMEAVYWKNGKEIALPKGTSASAIYVRNDTVYVSGYNATYTGDVSMCWVNGTPIELEEGRRAHSIYTDAKGVIYVAGYGMTDSYTEVVRYWTGRPENIGSNSFRIAGTSSASNATLAYGIHAREKNGKTDVIVCGVEYDGKKKTINAKQWVNRRNKDLTYGESGTAASSAFAYNDKFYVSGKEGRTACYWVSTTDDLGVTKTCEKIKLSDGNYDTYANSIFVKEGVVYVAGYSLEGVKNDPIIWRDNEKIDFISKDNPNLEVTDVTGVFVK